MNSYKKLDEFLIKGRGKVFVVKNDRYRNKNKENWWSDLQNKEVEINGKIYICIGIESYAIPFLEKGEPIGLLVKEK